MSDTPLVSAIMPVYGQQEMVEAAIASFLLQDWPHLELILIDDSPTPIDLSLISSLPPPVSHCPVTHYVRIDDRMKIGPKRNLACEIAQGEIIVHFDSDDWSAPSRIRDQVERLLASGKSVSGYHSMLFWDSDSKEAFKYKGSEDYSLGTSLCYRKTFWQKHSFVPESPKSWEDNVFVQAARNENEIVAVDAGQFMVARIHAGNTCPKKPREHPQQWSPVDAGEIPQEFLDLANRSRQYPSPAANSSESTFAADFSACPSRAEVRVQPDQMDRNLKGKTQAHATVSKCGCDATAR